MAIEYDMYFRPSVSEGEIVKKIAKIFGSDPEVKKPHQTKIHQWSSNIGLATFSPCDDQDVIGVVEDNYSFTPEYRIGFRLYSDLSAEKELVLFVDQILRYTSGDLVLEFNGEFPVILRQNGKVKVNHEYDDGTNFPFDELTVETEVIRMPCQ